MSGIDQLLAELRADPKLASHADALEAALRETEREGDENGDALEFFDGIRWIARQRSRSIIEKLIALHKLVSFETKGRTTIHLRSFLGWDK
jgi:hypothetical protein